MTTYEEISTCKKANFEFFTSRARINLACYRDELIKYGKNHGFTKLSRSGFRSNMKARRERHFYVGAA
jgi:hypothetical protein